MALSFETNEARIEYLLENEASFQHVLVENVSPLLYCVSLMDEDLAARIIQEGHMVDLDEPWNDGNTPLHMAVALDCLEISHLLLEANADPEWTTEDVHSQFGPNIITGGKTCLHVAAESGNIEAVRLLLEYNANLQAVDFDGNLPIHLAATRRRSDVVSMLLTNCTLDEPLPTIEVLLAKEKENQQAARTRYKETKDTVKPILQQVHILQTVWSVDECNLVLQSLVEKTDEIGWTKKRHTAYATTDIPAFKIHGVHEFVRQSIIDRVFPRLTELYKFDQHVEFGFRDLFYVKYDAKPGEQAYLNVHQDGSIVSFTILLNSRDDFEGGGTYFEHTGEVISGQQGDCVLFSGKVRHGGQAVLNGTRYILVGFLSACNRLEKRPIVS